MFVHQMLPLACSRLATAAAETPLYEVAKLLARDQYNLVVVCDARGRMTGVVNDSDVVHAVSTCRPGCRHACAFDCGMVMTREVVSCRTHDFMADVLSTMKNAGVRHVPVVDEEGKPVGVVYARDLLEELYGELQYEEKELVNYVIGVGYH